jgi:hypothetical protein
MSVARRSGVRCQRALVACAGYELGALRIASLTDGL